MTVSLNSETVQTQTQSWVSVIRKILDFVQNEPTFEEKKGRKGRKRECDGTGAVEGEEGKAGRSLSLPSFTVVPSVQLRISFY